MLRGRLALASVYLCFVCVLANKRPPPCSKDMIINVKTLIDSITKSKSLDCRLYTPTIEHYQICPSSTMKCFAEEFRVLFEEWEAIPNGFSPFDRKLQKLASALNNKTESGCLQCELFEEKSAEEFLTALLSMIQLMNSQNC